MSKAKTGKGPAIVYPVEGAYLSGIPAVPTTTDGATGERLVATGAFRYEGPEILEDGEQHEIDVHELSADAAAALAFYAPEPSDDEPETADPTETPQEA